MVRLRLGAYALLLLMGAGVSPSSAVTGNAKIVVSAVDGRTGRPLTNQHVLLFGGPSVEAAREQQQHYELLTDSEGKATLALGPETQWIQVWVDWHVLCVPKNPVFSVADILSLGVKAPNTCGSTSERATPGRLVVFARPEHFWEKMRQ